MFSEHLRTLPVGIRAIVPVIPARTRPGRHDRTPLRSFSTLVGWTITLVALAQQPLDGYIAQGLANNVVLQQKHIALDHALADLKEARSLFLPALNLNASYLSGEGGRYFDFPVGDLVNPVYRTLNQFIGQDRFPMVDNVQAYLNPKNYYDAHVRASMPLLNTEIIHHQRVQQHAVQLQEYEVAIFRRELVKDIKVAYYQVLMASEAVRSYTSALQLLDRNVEVTRSLKRHGAGVSAQVLRAQAEREQITAQLAQATNQLANARRYFNFLLNVDLEAPVDLGLDVHAALRDTITAGAPDIGRREELMALRTAVGLRDAQTKLTTTYWVPKLSTFIDLGYQGMDWTVDEYADYYLFGVQLDVPLFNGGRHRLKVQRARLEREIAALTERHSTQQLLLGATQARTELATAQAVLRSAQARHAAAASYFTLIEKGFNEGVNTQIEYLDARNQLTGAEVQLAVARTTVLQKLAELERQTATYPLQ